MTLSELQEMSVEDLRVFAKEKDFKILAHECGHAACNILDFVDAFPQDATQCEVLLRLQSYFIEAVLSEL